MFGALKRGFRSMASLILVRNVVGELQPKRTLAASHGFLAAARLSCSHNSMTLPVQSAPFFILLTSSWSFSSTWTQQICRDTGVTVTDALWLAEDRPFWRQIATAGSYGWTLRVQEGRKEGWPTGLVLQRKCQLAISKWRKVKTWTTLSTFFNVFNARCTLVQSAVLRSHVVCLSVCPSDCL